MLSLNNRRFRAAMEHSAIGTALVALSGDWLHTNPALRALLGYSEDELKALTFQQLTHPDDLRAGLDVKARLIAGGIPACQLEKRYIRKDGSFVWCLLSVSVVRDDTGTPLYFLSHVQDISDRKAAEQEREDLLQQACAASVAKSEFLSTMSHEIRTPLNGILGMVQAMSGDDLSAPQRERLRVIQDSGAALLAILNDVLDLAKIESRKIELEEIEFDLGGLLSSTVAAFVGVAEQKAVSLELELGDAQGVYRGDPTRVRQIVSNLLSNALKFTTSGGVTLCVARQRRGVELKVIDTGQGIPEQALATIFDKFTQADASTTRRHGGTGLGLAICAELAQLMGGSITVASELGRGSVFSVALPLARVRDAVPAADVGPDVAQRPDQELKVLAADDNPTNRLVLATLLGQAGVEVSFAEDGQQALELWRTQAWDVILMDANMPVLDGLAATQAIREEERAKGRVRTPIIALTANAMPKQRAHYVTAGMDGFVAKPIEVQALYDELARVLAEPRDQQPVHSEAQAAVARAL